jgi:hypothetical protein
VQLNDSLLHVLTRINTPCTDSAVCKGHGLSGAPPAIMVVMHGKLTEMCCF